MGQSLSKRALVDSVHQEHEELRQALGKVQRTLRKREAAIETVSEILTCLGKDVTTHFSDEETAGFFDDVLERAPHFSDRIDSLRAEHQQLSAAVERLQQVVADGDGSEDWWQRIEDVFRDFGRELMHHESRENELLLEAYTDDIGAAD